MVRTSTYFFFCFLFIMSGLLSGQDTLQVRTEEEPTSAAIETETSSQDTLQDQPENQASVPVISESDTVQSMEDTIRVVVETDTVQAVMEIDTAQGVIAPPDTLDVEISDIDTVSVEDVIEPVIKSHIVVLKAEIVGISTGKSDTLSEIILSEIDSTHSATGVNLSKIQQLFSELRLEQSECLTDSCIKEVARMFRATHTVAWSLDRKYKLYRLELKYLDVTTDTVVLVNQVKRRYWGDEAGLEVELRRSVWELLSVQPQEGRFPEERNITRLLKQKIDDIGREYVIGGAAIISLGMVYLLTQSGKEEKKPDTGIGLPPDWPEP